MTSVKTTVHHWFHEVWNLGREDAIDEMMAADCVAHGLTDEHGNELVGRAPYKDFFRKFRAEFTNIKVEVQDAVVEGNRVAARCLVTGKHVPSGNQIEFSGMTFCHLRDGKIAEAWNNFDFHVMQQQLL